MALETNILSLAGGGNSGGGYSNMLYFDAPGSWTSPSTVTEIGLEMMGAGGGGAGGASAAPGGPSSAAGGASTSTIAFGKTYPGVPGGAGTGTAGVYNHGSFAFSNIILSNTSNYRNSANSRYSDKFDRTPRKILSGSGPFPVSGPSPSAPTYTPAVMNFSYDERVSHFPGYKVAEGGQGGASGSGGGAIMDFYNTTISSSTMYPISIGQAGAGGGGPPAWGAGSNGAGPGGGATGVAGGIVPLSFLNYLGNSNYTSVGNASGGATGVHGLIIINYK